MYILFLNLVLKKYSITLNSLCSLLDFFLFYFNFHLIFFILHFILIFHWHFVLVLLTFDIDKPSLILYL